MEGVSLLVLVTSEIKKKLRAFWQWICMPSYTEQQRTEDLHQYLQEAARGDFERAFVEIQSRLVPQFSNTKSEIVQLQQRVNALEEKMSILANSPPAL